MNDVLLVRRLRQGITDLGTLGGYESLGIYVNNGGQVIGIASNAIPDPYSLFGWGAQLRTFLWENGVKRDLGTLGGPDAIPGANCTNQRNGLIVGESYTSFIPNPSTGVPTIDPFLWKNGRMLDLGTLGGTFGFAQCANSGGQVAGQSNLSGDSTFHPFFWERGVLTDLGTFGGNNGTTNWMNEAGDVVGKADLPGSQTHDGFLWRHGVMTDLGTVPGDPCSNATSINENRQIVGNSSDCVNPLHAFLWEQGGPMVDLNSLIPSNSSLQLTNAEDINERGEIASIGVPAGCQPADVNLCGHAYLLIPDGDCDSDCEGRIAASQNNAAPAQNPATMKQGSESPVSPVERFRNRCGSDITFPANQPRRAISEVPQRPKPKRTALYGTPESVLRPAGGSLASARCFSASWKAHIACVPQRRVSVSHPHAKEAIPRARRKHTLLFTEKAVIRRKIPTQAKSAWVGSACVSHNLQSSCARLLSSEPWFA